MATPMLLLLAVMFGNVVALDTAVQSSTQFASFQRYPFPDYCGTPLIPRERTGQSCPVAVCVAERTKCEAADLTRRRCQSSNCSPSVSAAALKNATALCAAATKCVQNRCYSSATSCRVRSFLSGDCCCATCAPQATYGEFSYKPVTPYTLARASVALYPFATAKIDGKTDLSSFITGRNGARVLSIRLEWTTGPQPYKLVVVAVNQVYLYFTDLDNTLHFMVTPRGTTVTTSEILYSAVHAGIKCIQWSPRLIYPFPVCN